MKITSTTILRNRHRKETVTRTVVGVPSLVEKGKDPSANGRDNPSFHTKNTLDKGL